MGSFSSNGGYAGRRGYPIYPVSTDQPITESGCRRMLTPALFSRREFLRNARGLYSLSFRKGIVSESELPAYGILGTSSFLLRQLVSYLTFPPAPRASVTDTIIMASSSEPPACAEIVGLPGG